jgi:hypothetical protein
VPMRPDRKSDPKGHRDLGATLDAVSLPAEMVGHLRVEPRTQGLKVRCPECRVVPGSDGEGRLVQVISPGSRWFQMSRRAGQCRVRTKLRSPKGARR